MRHTTTLAPISSMASGGNISSQQALLSLQAAVLRAEQSMQGSRNVTYEVRNDLLYASDAFKDTIDAATDETIYDLAALLDLIVLTAFSLKGEGRYHGLKLLEGCISILHRSLAENALNGSAANECSMMEERVWNWLGCTSSAPSEEI